MPELKLRPPVPSTFLQPVKSPFCFGTSHFEDFIYGMPGLAVRVRCRKKVKTRTLKGAGCGNRVD
jgi:hypothetical protein